MAKSCTVGCALPSGIVLRPSKLITVDGETRAVPDGDVIALEHGDNPGMDAERINAWMEANKDSDIVVNGVVYVLPETPKAALKPLDQPDPEDPPAQASDAAAKQIKAAGKGNS